LALCAPHGTLVEFVAVRLFASRGSNARLMSVALGIVLDNLVMFTFGKGAATCRRRWPSRPFSWVTLVWVCIRSVADSGRGLRAGALHLGACAP
jgi:hypothetical protein